MPRWILALLLCGLFGCGRKDLCHRFYTPYPDFISQRQRSSVNANLLDAMALYDKGDFAQAAVLLRKEVDKNDRDVTSRMYLVSALLGAGDPYKAEMHLDFMERAPDHDFKDQVEWYYALCWLCSGQDDRALQRVQWIAAQPHHTYKQQAGELAEALGGK